MSQLSISSFESDLRDAAMAGDNDRVAEVTKAYNKERIKRGGYAAIGAPEEDEKRANKAASSSGGGGSKSTSSGSTKSTSSSSKDDKGGDSK